ncbi:MAG: ABC transporter permease [Spirochaetota bacterium]
MGPIALYGRLVGVSVRSQLQYKLSFVMQTIGHLLLTGGEFLALWALFSRFGSMDGWELAQVCVFYGITNVSFAFASAATTGFDHVGELIRLGDFDRILLRPRSTVVMLLGHEFTVRRSGRLVQGVAVLGYGLVTSGAIPAVATAALVLWTIAGSVSLFVGLRILQACVAFRTVESIEIMNVFTYGGVTTASYPFSIFVDWFRTLFTFVIPLAAVSYYPGLAVMGLSDPLGAPPWVGWLSPFAGVAFLAIALAVWRYALRWYSSTGS